ncbi:MAG: DUF4333 domain-containing protein [Mycobacterium sp.]|uniref:DUF4333 domain-containing protein n=1 Tax=Mycobacterium sp. TaxID=1785 RepID=UPI001EBE4B73|nr:DUF4333 domain-containing protein [Mycobacterium sp.]MBW0019949.1 DUF4333 domain-containing protein [Mycobacterium sp.]
MRQTFYGCYVATVLVGAMVLGVAGCSSKMVIKPEVAAKSVVNLESQKTGFTPTDVRCPSGVEAKVGATFDCHFTGPDGPYTAHMRVTKVDGQDLTFDIKTQRS